MTIDYQTYLASPEWRSLRQKVLSRDSDRCQTCLSQEDLEVHHKTYERLGHEDLADLITLCVHCHRAITSSIRERRYGKPLILTDVERRIPTIHLEVKSDDTTEIAIQAHIRITPAAPQRADRRPFEPFCETTETGEQQTRQDGRRF